MFHSYFLVRGSHGVAKPLLSASIKHLAQTQATLGKSNHVSAAQHSMQLAWTPNLKDTWCTPKFWAERLQQEILLLAARILVSSLS